MCTHVIDADSYLAIIFLCGLCCIEATGSDGPMRAPGRATACAWVAVRANTATSIEQPRGVDEDVSGG